MSKSHLHPKKMDQCGAITKSKKPCLVVTGGGLCWRHKAKAPSKASSKTPKKAPKVQPPEIISLPSDKVSSFFEQYPDLEITYKPQYTIYVSEYCEKIFDMTSKKMKKLQKLETKPIFWKEKKGDRFVCHFNSKHLQAYVALQHFIPDNVTSGDGYSFDTISFIGFEGWGPKAKDMNELFSCERAYQYFESFEISGGSFIKFGVLRYEPDEDDFEEDIDVLVYRPFS